MLKRSAPQKPKSPEVPKFKIRMTAGRGQPPYKVGSRKISWPTSSKIFWISRFLNFWMLLLFVGLTSSTYLLDFCMFWFFSFLRGWPFQATIRMYGLLDFWFFCFSWGWPPQNIFWIFGFCGLWWGRPLQHIFWILNFWVSGVFGFSWGWPSSSDFQCFRISRFLDCWNSVFSAFGGADLFNKSSGFLDFKIPGFLECWISGFILLWWGWPSSSYFQCFRISRFLDCWNSVFSAFGGADLFNKSSGFLDFKIPGFLECWISGFCLLLVGLVSSTQI